MDHRVIFLRHAQRLDHTDKDWASTTFRAHDSPLTSKGKVQALDAGVKIHELLRNIEGKHRITFYVSPLIRTVETAREAIKALDVTEDQQLEINIEKGLCENDLNLRRRLLGVHKDSSGSSGKRDGTKLPNGQTRTMKTCSPVLLSSEDLGEFMKPFTLNPSYKVQVEVSYDNECYELDDITHKRTIVQERIGKCVERVLARHKLVTASENQIIVFVTHAAPWKYGIEYLLGSKISWEPSTVAYCHLYELNSTSELDQWKFKSEWKP